MTVINLDTMLRLQKQVEQALLSLESANRLYEVAAPKVEGKFEDTWFIAETRMRLEEALTAADLAFHRVAELRRHKHGLD